MSFTKNNAISSRSPSSIVLIALLALRDLLYDRKVALCIIFSLVSVIAPLLLLFGLKSGIVTQLNDQLLNDPRNLEIRMMGNGDYDEAWLSTLAAQKGVSFSIPLTRSLNTQADLRVSSQQFLANVEIIPTAEGDPLMTGVSLPINSDEIVLSAQTAYHLKVSVGEDIQLFISRKYQGETQRAQHRFKIVGILGESKYSRAAAFVTLPVLVAMEDYRDGLSAPLFSEEGHPAKPRTGFAKARVYAENLEAIVPLNDWFLAQNIEVITQKAQIESVKAITYVLNVIFSVIVWIALLGCIASLIGAFLANIDRKRKEMALLRLIGFQKRAVAFYIVMQALILTCCAFVMGTLLYALGSTLFNTLLGDHLPEQGFVSHLLPIDLLIAFLLALTIAIVVAGLGAVQAIKIQPSESLREL